MSRRVRVLVIVFIALYIAPIIQMRYFHWMDVVLKSYNLLRVSCEAHFGYFSSDGTGTWYGRYQVVLFYITRDTRAVDLIRFASRYEI
jgi:hypothetical protein